MQAGRGQVVLLGGRVVAGAGDHGQFFNAASEFPVAGDQLIGDGGELGDVGTVAREARETTGTPPSRVTASTCGARFLDLAWPGLRAGIIAE